MTATNPAADWAALALAANSTDDPSAVLVPASLFGTNAVVTAAVVLAVAAILASAFTTGFVVHRVVVRGFSGAGVTLILVNVLALALEAAEMARAQAPAPTGVLFALRNMWIPLGVLGLNLLQIQVAAVFQGSLIRLSLFERARLPWIGIASFGIYTLLVAACGLALNVFLLVSVRRNTPEPVQREDEAATLATIGRDCVRPLQGLLAFVVVLDVAGLVLFVVSLLFANNTEANITFNGLVQISLAFFGFHMNAETVMYDQVVTIFLDKMPKEYIARVGISSWLGGGANDVSEASSVRALIGRDGTGSQSAVAGSSSIDSAAPSIVVQGSGDNSGEAVYSSRR
ncbi:hypothetical protein HK105_206512 [Polyrhizophydium stewartii]|uniref:Uncharacterized protein n=1 Tax=Polyrhizophydium stewartii TaxID=2732419 RepID=A0ABR4N368_9FUNG